MIWIGRLIAPYQCIKKKGMVLGMKQQRSPNTYTPKERNLYLTGLLGQNMIYNIIGTGLVFYFQSVLFIPAMATGVIFAIARVWDAINDPMMGTIVDRTNTKWGKCRPYLIFVPAAVCVITILCFCNGIYGSQNSSTVNGLIIAWAGVSYILWGMTFTVGDIPLWGITARMTDDENDRASLLSLARIAGGVGGIVLAIIVPLSQAVGNSLTKSQGLSTQKGQQFGFIIVAVILSVIGCGLFQLSSFAKERVKSSDEHYTIKENFQLMWRNRPFRQIMISSILRAPIMLLMMVAMTLLSYYYGDYNQKSYVVYMIVLGGGIFGGQFIAMAFAPMLVKKFEKKKVYNISSIASGIAFALIFVIYKLAPNKLDQPLWLAICCVVFTIAAAGMGIVNVYQSVMIADTIDYEEYEHGIRPDGVFFAGQSFCTKLNSGIAALIQGIVYSVVGFSGEGVEKVNALLEAGASFKADPAFEPYRMAMFFLCSIPPAIGMLLSVLPMLHYDLPDKKHATVLEELRIRRQEKADKEAK